MLEFSAKSILIIPEQQVKEMFEQTMKGATQHAGDAASVAKLLTRINTQQVPFMLLGVPGQSYIVANLRMAAGLPPGQLIQMMNQSQGVKPPFNPIINGSN